MDTTPHASEPTAQSPVTPGHRRSLALLQQTDELTQAINIYRQALGGIEVYLRPTDRGLTVIPLHLGTPKFIGAGSINSLPVDADEVAGHVDEFHKKLAGARGAKPEEQFSLKLIAGALSNQLRLPESDLRFLTQEWRFGRPNSVGRLDLLAVEPVTSRLVVIELKRESEQGPQAFEQALRYVNAIDSDDEVLLDYFGSLAEAMSDLYAPGEPLDGSSIGQSCYPRAEVWSRVARVRMGTGIGPQHEGDSAFVARMRLHQSWWRAERLCVPWGTGPTAASNNQLGSMLRQREAAKGANFLTESVHQLFTSRKQQEAGVEPYRCAHNLLSSQSMCFNLFGPLALDSKLALRMLGPLLPVPAVQITGVRIEYAPKPKVEYLGYRTAFDAFVEFVDEQGQPAFVGIETKLSEPFSDNRYERDRYSELTLNPDSPWSGSPDQLAAPRWNQLWRDQLLVEAIRTHVDRPHGSRGWLAVVAHPEDPTIGETVTNYRYLLSDQESLLDWPLDSLLSTFRASAQGESEVSWLKDFEDRYLNLCLSE